MHGWLMIEATPLLASGSGRPLQMMLTFSRIGSPRFGTLLFHFALASFGGEDEFLFPMIGGSDLWSDNGKVAILRNDGRRHGGHFSFAWRLTFLCVVVHFVAAVVGLQMVRATSR